MSVTIPGGLELQVPLPYETNYHDSFVSNFATPIATHDHTGSGKGEPLTADALADNSITGEKIRLANGESLKALNAAGSANVNLVYLDAEDYPTFPSLTAKTWTPTVLSATGGTVSAETIVKSSYIPLGSLCIISLEITGTLAVTGSPAYIYVNLPFLAPTGVSQRGGCYFIRPGDSSRDGIYTVTNLGGVGTLQFYKPDISALSAGAFVADVTLIYVVG